MKDEIKEALIAPIRAFHLPRYAEIPDVGLYLEQTAKYINGFLAPLSGMEITTSMISNYVKQGLIANPVKKQYAAEQVAYLIFIAVSKTVLSMENIRLLIDMQKPTYSSQVAYDYFCSELENVVGYVFGMKDAIDSIGSTDTDETVMLRNTIIAVAHKIYLDKCFEAIKADFAQSERNNGEMRERE